MTKKIISVLLASVLMFSAFVLPSFADEKDGVTFAVAADIHSRDEETIPVYHPENELYFHARNTGNLYWEAEGILASFLDSCRENNYDFVLIPGDTADSGTKNQHERIAAILSDFEEKSGIPVYIVPGNHDLKSTSREEFVSYYSAFGYDEALEKDKETASYTADLPGDFRLIAVDSNDPGKDGDGITKQLLSWIEKQAKKADGDGKTVIFMMHHTLLAPIPPIKLLMKDFVIRNNTATAEKFTRWGIRYVFTGHEHGNNIASYTGINGETVYDVLTTSLSSYPLEYRVVECAGNEMKISCERVTEYNPLYLREGYTDAQLAAMTEDYTAYSLGFFKYSIEQKIDGYLKSDFLKDKLKAEDGCIADALDAVMPVVENALYMPLYDDGTGAESVEGYTKKSGAALPETDYKNLFDLATTLVAVIYYGGENLPVESSPEAETLAVGLNTMLKYVISKAGDASVRLVLGAVLDAAGISQDKEFFFLDKIYYPCSKGLYTVSLAAMKPFLDEILVDDEICDRDTVLPLIRCGEDSGANALTALFAKIKAFFETVFSFFRNFFIMAK